MGPLRRLRVAAHSASRRMGFDFQRIPSERWLAQLPVRTVIDVGANVGQFATLARRLFPLAQIYAFEPLEDCVVAMRRTFAGDPRCRIFPVALGAERGVVTFNRSASSASSSVLEMAELHREAFPYTAAHSEVTVPVERLDEMLQDPLDGDILLKLDVQGYEHRVLDGAPQTLAKATVVIAEVSFQPLYLDQSLFADTYERLASAGFVYRGNLGQLLNPHDGAVLSADAVFMRPDQKDWPKNTA